MIFAVHETKFSLGRLRINSQLRLGILEASLLMNQLNYCGPKALLLQKKANRKQDQIARHPSPSIDRLERLRISASHNKSLGNRVKSFQGIGSQWCSLQAY